MEKIERGVLKTCDPFSEEPMNLIKEEKKKEIFVKIFFFTLVCTVQENMDEPFEILIGTVDTLDDRMLRFKNGE